MWQQVRGRVCHYNSVTQSEQRAHQGHLGGAVIFGWVHGCQSFLLPARVLLTNGPLQMVQAVGKWGSSMLQMLDR